MGKQDSSKVCVTGRAGYLGSWLVKKLLEKGYPVHATLGNLDDKSRVWLLKFLPGADTKLVLFQADIYNPDEFKHAIQGCEFVFHVATSQKTVGSWFKASKEIVKAAISGVRSITESCIQSQSVKRLIYTASVLVYAISKALAQKEALSYNGNPADGKLLEVVTVPCRLVGGETLLSFVPLSVEVMFSQLIGKSLTFKGLEFMEELLGSVPIPHIEGVCDAHIFWKEKPSMRGRFLCAAANPTIRETAMYFRENYSQNQISED